MLDGWFIPRHDSKTQLRRYLRYAGRSGTDDTPEGGAVDVAINRGAAVELRVVGGIERFEADFQRFRFGLVVLCMAASRFTRPGP